MPTIPQSANLTASSLVPHLEKCRYVGGLLAQDYDFGPGSVPIATFAHAPFDARSICIGVLEPKADPACAVKQIQPLSAPVVFTCHEGALQWWKQTMAEPRLIETIEARQVPAFFDAHRADFAPEMIFEGKTRRRLPGHVQLSFVDAGLMPALEEKTGDGLSRLVDSLIRGMEDFLGTGLRHPSDIEAVFKSAFWLLAAKILRDKRVSNFIRLDLTDVETVFRRVGRHYGDAGGLPPGGGRWRQALEAAATTVLEHPSLAHISTESLGYLYENTLIPREVRKALGTHSTPTALVDYIVWQLWPWIEEIPEERRHVFEAACGHGAFLVSAMRMMRQSSSFNDGGCRHDYLRSHLHGVEIDAFALEIAKLSMTLADLPHGNHWDLKRGDMFLDSNLEVAAENCGIFLANPPYERFTDSERQNYREAKTPLTANTKACEMLLRTLPRLPAGACFGVLVPQGLLHNREGLEVRRALLEECELSEIDVFADSLFEKSDHEFAVLLGRRKVTASGASATFWFRRVRESGVELFRERFAFSSEERVEKSRFAADASANLSLPELDAVWRYLDNVPTLGDCATINQGLFYRGSLPGVTWTIHDPPHSGDPLGYATVPRHLTIFGLPKKVGLNMNPDVIDRWVAGAPTGQPQVLLNYAPVSRQPWKLKAVLDTEGLALTNRFSTVRPVAAGVTALWLWALLNSPVANAFAYSHLGKRDILIGTMRRMPVPEWSPANAAQIEEAAHRYRELARSHPQGPLFNEAATPEAIRHALLEMDAAVLRAYDLPPNLERQLLSLFTGIERKGVGCDFHAYYPPGFNSYLPLHVLISEMFEAATADRVGKHFADSASPYVSRVLAAAVAAFDPE